MFSAVSSVFGACSTARPSAPDLCVQTPLGDKPPLGSDKAPDARPTHSLASQSTECLISSADSDEAPLTLTQPVLAEEKAELERLAARRLSRELDAMHELVRVAEFQALLDQTRKQMRSMPPLDEQSPVNRYGLDARLPAFDQERHIPTLALINPRSGAQVGADILAITRRTPYYQSRFFDIVSVVRDQQRGGLLDVFRLELNAAKDEAKAKGVRPRVISAGGDGTASFSLFIIFLALKADRNRADEGLMDAGNGFIWSDEEMAESFPALVQMPLGTANDFGRTLGWGHRYPGSRAQEADALESLCRWLEAAMSPDSREVNFDLWGIMPAPGEQTCDFKVCELGGQRGASPKVVVDGRRQLVMKKASTSVPFLCCLYFSAGFFAYMTARFQLNRRKLPLLNKLEYVRQGAGIITETVPPQLSVGLGDLVVTCGASQYFPPRNRQKVCGGSKYRELGFLNVNWQGGVAHGADRAPPIGRMCSTREPAKFNDGMVDMYRLKLSSPLKAPHLTYQTDKKVGPVAMTYSGGRGKGLFFQWDGEARFAFNPKGEPFTIGIRGIMQVPVVLGPEYDAKISGDPNSGAPVSFRFVGETEAERSEVAARMLRCVRGELDRELNASREEMLAAGFQCEQS